MHRRLLLAVFAIALVSVEALVTQVAVHRVPTNAHVSPIKAKLSKWHAKWANADKNDDPIYLDMMQGLFVTNVTVGTPPQPFLIGLDTGSADFWLIDATCKSGACNGFPSTGHQRNLFNKTISTTYVDTDDQVQICYVDGSCTTGDLGYDTIRFGSVVDTKQSFGVMSYLNDDMGYMSCDGIFGAAWPSVSSFGVEPPLQRVLNQLDKPLFSVWLDKHPKASPTYTGLITYGALDAKNCEGSWNFLPLIGDSFWNYELDSFSLGTKKLRGTSGQSVTVDTGTSWLNFPNAVVDTIVSKIGAEA